MKFNRFNPLDPVISVLPNGIFFQYFLQAGSLNCNFNQPLWTQKLIYILRTFYSSLF